MDSHIKIQEELVSKGGKLFTPKNLWYVVMPPRFYKDTWLKRLMNSIRKTRGYETGWYKDTYIYSYSDKNSIIVSTKKVNEDGSDIPPPDPAIVFGTLLPEWRTNNEKC